MPVNLPHNQATDPRLLTLLNQIMENGGSLSLTEEEHARLQEEVFFADAERCNLLTTDHGGEWMSGAVVSITRQGKLMIGAAGSENPWKRLESILRRRIGGS